VSPDGNWLAYNSSESGVNQVYAMAFPQGGSRVQISIDGGTDPIWSPLGDEIFFLDQEGLMVADIDLAGTLETELAVSRPRRMMTGPFGSRNPNREFCLTPDGQRFLLAYLPEESMPRRIRVVVNWFTELAGISAGK
jgi:Tol biopolymer transport system component